jgi:hypothetical protein
MNFNFNYFSSKPFNKMRKNKMELYNSEGPCLVANRIGDDLFEILDQWNVHLRNVRKGELLCIYHGVDTLVDSRGRIWDLKKEWSKDAMPDLERVLEFIKQPFFRRLPNLQRQFDQ